MTSDDTAAPLRVRSAMDTLATNVAIITTPTPTGQHGVTANAWGELPGEPLVLITLAERSRSLDLVLAAGTFAVNVLGEGHEALARQFAAREQVPGERFRGVATRIVGDCVVLSDVVAALVCVVTGDMSFGARRIVIGSVVAAERGPGPARPLIFSDNAFRRLDEPRPGTGR